MMHFELHAYGIKRFWAFCSISDVNVSHSYSFFSTFSIWVQVRCFLLQVYVEAEWVHVDNEWVKKRGQRPFPPTLHKNFPAEISTKQHRMSAKIRDLLWLIKSAHTVFMTTRDPPPPLRFQGDECTCAPGRDSQFGYALHGDPLAVSAERWSQAAWSGSPESPKGVHGEV